MEYNGEPKYITNENMYAFIIWANETSDVENINIIIQTNIHEWIKQMNISWEYALTFSIDTINRQKDVETEIARRGVDDVSGVDDVGEEKEEEEYEKKIKPSTPEERRLLFAKAAELRVKF